MPYTNKSKPIVSISTIAKLCTKEGVYREKEIKRIYGMSSYSIARRFMEVYMKDSYTPFTDPFTDSNFYRNTRYITRKDFAKFLGIKIPMNQKEMEYRSRGYIVLDRDDDEEVLTEYLGYNPYILTKEDALKIEKFIVDRCEISFRGDGTLLTELFDEYNEFLLNTGNNDLEDNTFLFGVKLNKYIAEHTYICHYDIFSPYMFGVYLRRDKR